MAIEKQKVAIMNKRIKIVNNEIKVTNNKIRIVNDGTKIANDVIRTENNEIKIANDVIKTENNEIKIANDVIKTENNEIKVANEGIRTENNRIKIVNDDKYADIENIANEATKYFKGNIGYKRLFDKMRKKYISFGEIKGNITIDNPKDIEKQALSGLMKKDYKSNKSITINLKKLEERLKETRFSNIKLVDILKKYFAEEITTKKQSQELYQKNINCFFDELLEKQKNTYIYRYLKQIVEQKNNIYSILKSYYNKDKELFESEITTVCKAINNLPRTKTRIPVYATNIVADPHALDSKRIAGSLFVMLLSYIDGIEKPNNSVDLSELYYRHNLLVDDVSNMVLCKNICAVTAKNKEHMGWKGFEQSEEPLYATLYNLSKISYINDKYNCKRVIITENPAVFMALAEKPNLHKVPLVCTYGQVKLSGIILLNMLEKAGFKLFYSGDIDPEGIQIADKLKQRYKNSMSLVGFDTNTYHNNISNKTISASRIKKLRSIKSNELKEVCDELCKYKKAAYEEKNIENLLKIFSKC